ncbi:SDR family oxidoreductase [Rhodovulum sulfidophilum]|uniref:SDR family NAD(P)-dependent oxidoreductase n=1 Tax=Rhodovulum sulfidophilum TaxID=35806 RepID=UPI001924E96C|nr:SDR family NAD(P)-dependent oxidoreductase [Rhodovulum sulfidophilum]MBL3595399.1 SDR family oxidoreductase [Rhodovulum sulfidophilum]
MPDRDSTPPARVPVTFDFTGRSLILTGANGGIGRAVARIFAQGGAHLLLADRDLAPLEDFAATLPGPGARICQQIDAADPDAAQALIDEAVTEFGGIDHIVPSAGIYLAEPFGEMTDAAWRRTLSINLDGVFYLLRRAVPHLREGSSIVTLSSMAAYRGALTNAHYGASKGAMVSLTRSLANELGPKTRVNGVAPGIIETPMIGDYMKTRAEATLANTPLKRLGQAEEVAAAIAFLCSDAAGFITGETLQVNGGLHMA